MTVFVTWPTTLRALAAPFIQYLFANAMSYIIQKNGLTLSANTSWRHQQQWGRVL